MEAVTMFNFAEALSNANKMVAKIEIKTKKYVPVNERIKAFRICFPGWNLTSEILSVDSEKVSMKAYVTDPDGVVKATGHAEETRASSNINKTSALENCETSAYGRVLGCLGIGIDDNFGSADEMRIALELQEKAEEYQVKFLADNLTDKQKDWILKKHGYKMLDQLTKGEAAKYIQTVEERKEEDILKEIKIDG